MTATEISRGCQDGKREKAWWYKVSGECALKDFILLDLRYSGTAVFSCYFYVLYSEKALSLPTIIYQEMKYVIGYILLW